MERHTLVVDHDQAAVALYYWAFGGEIKAWDLDLFLIDVLPDIEFCPVAKGEHADAFVVVDACVVDVP